MARSCSPQRRSSSVGEILNGCETIRHRARVQSSATGRAARAYGKVLVPEAPPKVHTPPDHPTIAQPSSRAQIVQGRCHRWSNRPSCCSRPRRRPATFPYFREDPALLVGRTYISYFEVLNARWPHPDATALLTELRPLSADHSAPALTFTHGDLPGDTENTPLGS